MLATLAILGCALIQHAGAATVSTFEITNKSDTDANDLTIGINGALVPSTRAKPNPVTAPEVWSGGQDTGTKWVAGSPGQSQIKLCSVAPCPTTGKGTLPKDDSIKITLRGQNKIKIDPKATYFTLNGDQIPDSAQLVSANPDVQQRGDTAVVSVSNDSSDYYFLTSVEVWTGLTEDEAEDYLSTGMTTPTMMERDMTLAPNSANFFNLGAMTPGYVLMLYDFASGPTSLPSDALSAGEFVYAGTVPEPGTLALIALGLIGFSIAQRCRAGDQAQDNVDASVA
jgi:hypothetical protein